MAIIPKCINRNSVVFRMLLKRTATTDLHPFSDCWIPTISTFNARLERLDSGSGNNGSARPHLNTAKVSLSSRAVAAQWLRLKSHNLIDKSCDSLYTNCQQCRAFQTNAVLKYAKVDEDEEVVGRGEKILKVKLSTTRLDAVIKAGLGMSKNKIEKVLYDDRVRVNGERPQKKSEPVYEGDEIDIVRGYNKLNSKFLDVARVEIVKLVHPDDVDPDDSDDEKSFKIPATLRRSKTITIQNYSPKPWKGTDMEN